MTERAPRTGGATASRPDPKEGSVLTERQAAVLRAVVHAYVGHASPVSSGMLSRLLTKAISPASVRNTLAELAERGFVAKPHASGGRMPTELGFRLYVDELLGPLALGRHERRRLAGQLELRDPDAVVHAASYQLSDLTGQLGFVLVRRLARVELRHVSLVRLAPGRVLVVLVTGDGATVRRVVDDAAPAAQRELERMAALLNERLVGRTLDEVRARLAAEAEALRDQADAVLGRAVALALRALPEDAETQEDPGELVIATRLALLDQPEFRDPERLRELTRAVEDRERLVHLLDGMLEPGGVSVRLGAEVGEPALRHCGVVAASWGEAGVLGVIGPSRMDYGRVIPLVDTLSHLMTEKLQA